MHSVSARQLCGVYAALAEDIQGYAMSLSSNLGASLLYVTTCSHWVGIGISNRYCLNIEIMYIVACSASRQKLQGELKLVKLVDQACQGRSHPGHSQGA